MVMVTVMVMMMVYTIRLSSIDTSVYASGHNIFLRCNVHCSLHTALCSVAKNGESLANNLFFSSFVCRLFFANTVIMFSVGYFIREGKIGRSPANTCRWEFGKNPGEQHNRGSAKMTSRSWGEGGLEVKVFRPPF